MNTNSNLTELLDALETIRRENHPEIPKELLEEILNIEYEHQDNRSEAAQSKTLKFLEQHLNQLVDKNNNV